MRKQLDPRIPHLINNNVKLNHRSFIVLVGDKGRDQVNILQPILDWKSLLIRLCCYRLSTCISYYHKPVYLHAPQYFGAIKRILDSLGLLATLTGSLVALTRSY